MSVNFETTPIYVQTCKRSDGTIFDNGSGSSNANKILLGLESTGGNTPGFHALMRFATGDVITDTTMTIIRARLRVTANSRSTLGANYPFYAWAADFGASLAVGDYNQSYSNDSITSSTLRIPIGVIFAAGGTIADGTVGEVAIPSRFISKGTGNVSDFEVRPYVDSGSSLAQGANLNIYGGDSGVGASRPRIIGLAFTDAELQADNQYRFQAVGAETFVAFEVESTAGRAMKASTVLDARDWPITGQAESIPSQALTSKRAKPPKVAIGRAGAGGSFTFELTPEKWQKLLLGMMRYVGSEDVSAEYGGGNTGTYEHYFRTGSLSDIRTFTFVSRRGPFRYVYPGSMISSIEFSSSMDSIVTANVALSSLREDIYDADAAGISDSNLMQGSSGSDTVENSVLSFVGGLVSFDGSEDKGLVQSVGVALRQNVNERRGHNRKRGPFGHFPLGFMPEIRFQMELENEIQLRKYLGVDHKDFPFTAEKKIVIQEVSVAFAGSGGDASEFLADGLTYRQEFILTVTKGMYLVTASPVDGEGPIMLDCTLDGLYDTTSVDPTPGASGNLGTLENGAITITARNSEPGSTFDIPSETIPNLITVFPARISV